MTHADRKIELLNRITRELKRSMPYWSNKYGTPEEMVNPIINYDAEVRTEINTLIQTILEEIKSDTQEC